MYPVHDVDAMLLLAISLAAKRRPAELAEIIAAAELNQNAIPPEAKLAESFHRLAECGLLHEQSGTYTLTADAESIMATQSKKAKPPERLHDIKASLSDYTPKENHPPIVVTEEQLSAAIQTHQATKTIKVKNLLAPKPKPAEDSKRPPQRKSYKPFAARKRKF
jgi:prophage tail gpP-like protein